MARLPADFHFECPWCSIPIVVAQNEVNCGVFRCAVDRAGFQQINPHLPKQECDRLAAAGQIYGCGKPFRFNDATGKAEKCDYI